MADIQAYTAELSGWGYDKSECMLRGPRPPSSQGSSHPSVEEASQLVAGKSTLSLQSIAEDEATEPTGVDRSGPPIVVGETILTKEAGARSEIGVTTWPVGLSNQGFEPADWDDSHTVQDDDDQRLPLHAPPPTILWKY